MKNLFYLYIITLFSYLLFSCKKETPAILTDPCDNVYELRSKPYNGIYKASVLCPIGAKFIYPENYSYYAVCTNPNNDYEFCFVRINNDTQVADFCKYNFCSDKTTVLLKNSNTSCAWSVKDWLLFIKNENELWKMKSNGDNSVRIGTTLLNFGGWSPDGSKLINDSKILDENGNFISDLSSLQSSDLIWETDSTLFYSKENKIDKKIDIYRYNIQNKTSKWLYSRANTSGHEMLAFSAKEPYLYIKFYDDSAYLYMKLETKTGEAALIKTYSDYVPFFTGILKDKFLVSLNVTDTLTKIPCSINQRKHIALINLDGTNERQVLLPE